ncbi:MAG: SCP2 sterol-binding domain-containing protein [Wenzhouxiangellaceae bacterium]|nr:SCP2 sterol-binding domain-containing protein [Wenzhouxiangellaceae bacterium]
MQPSILAGHIARRMPPPCIVGLPLRAMPMRLQGVAVERLLNTQFRQALEAGDFEYLEDHALAVELADMRLRWVFGSQGKKLVMLDRKTPADTTIRGDAVEFLLLLARLEDPDTLFFQRRLQFSGNTVVGLTTRNLLDRLCWDELPLALRIVLNRAGRLGARLRSLRT